MDNNHLRNKCCISQPLSKNGSKDTVVVEFEIKSLPVSPPVSKTKCLRKHGGTILSLPSVAPVTQILSIRSSKQTRQKVKREQ